MTRPNEPGNSGCYELHCSFGIGDDEGDTGWQWQHLVDRVAARKIPYLQPPPNDQSPVIRRRFDLIKPVAPPDAPWGWND